MKHSPDRYDRIKAIEALVAFPCEESLKAVLNVFVHDRDCDFEAATALGKIGDKRSIPYLVAELAKPIPYSRNLDEQAQRAYLKDRIVSVLTQLKADAAYVDVVFATLPLLHIGGAWFNYYMESVGHKEWTCCLRGERNEAGFRPVVGLDVIEIVKVASQQFDKDVLVRMIDTLCVSATQRRWGASTPAWDDRALPALAEFCKNADSEVASYAAKKRDELRRNVS